MQYKIGQRVLVNNIDMEQAPTTYRKLPKSFTGVITDIEIEENYPYIVDLSAKYIKDCITIVALKEDEFQLIDDHRDTILRLTKKW